MEQRVDKCERKKEKTKFFKDVMSYVRKKDNTLDIWYVTGRHCHKVLFKTIIYNQNYT